MQNLLGIYELNGCFAPELQWYRINDFQCQTVTNGRRYIVYQTIIDDFCLSIEKEISPDINDKAIFRVNTLENGKVLAERIEGFYCSMEKIDMCTDD